MFSLGWKNQINIGCLVDDENIIKGTCITLKYKSILIDCEEYHIHNEDCCKKKSETNKNNNKEDESKTDENKKKGDKSKTDENKKKDDNIIIKIFNN